MRTSKCFFSFFPLMSWAQLLWRKYVLQLEVFNYYEMLEFRQDIQYIISREFFFSYIEHTLLTNYKTLFIPMLLF